MIVSVCFPGRYRTCNLVSTANYTFKPAVEPTQAYQRNNLLTNHLIADVYQTGKVVEADMVLEQAGKEIGVYEKGVAERTRYTVYADSGFSSYSAYKLLAKKAVRISL